MALLNGSLGSELWSVLVRIDLLDLDAHPAEATG